MKWFLIVVIVLIGSVVLSGCDLSFTPTPILPDCPGCDLTIPCVTGGLGIAGNLDPSNYEVVPLSPPLTWEYPPTDPSPYPYPAGSSDCPVGGFQIYLAPFNDKYNDLGGTVADPTSRTFTPSAPLEPATWYFWEVRATSGSVVGPWSGKHAFVTGPVCSLTQLVAPNAYAPTGIVNTLSPRFQWFGSYAYDSSCVPTGYHLELSEDASFATTVASVDLASDPSYAWRGWVPDPELEDCTDYHWRVAARNDSGLGAYDTQSFSTQVGICLIYFIPPIDLNCRIGPDPVYDRLAILRPGDRLPASARHTNEDETWYKLKLADTTECWAMGKPEDFDGDPFSLPESNDFPPLPEEKLHTLACNEIVSSAVCNSTPGCSYNIQLKRCE